MGVCVKLAHVRWALVAGLLFSAGDFVWPYGTARIPGFPGSIAADVQLSVKNLNLLAGVFAALVAFPFIINGLEVVFGQWSRVRLEWWSVSNPTMRLRAATATILLCAAAYIGITRELWFIPWIGWLLWTFVAPSEARAL